MNERDRRAMAIRLEEMQYVSLLWEVPLIGNTEVPLALGMSQTTWQHLKLSGEAPPAVYIGRRPFYRTADLQQWIKDRQATQNAGEDPGVEVEQQYD